MRQERWEMLPCGSNNGIVMVPNHLGGVTIMIWDTPDRALECQLDQDAAYRMMEALKGMIE